MKKVTALLLVLFTLNASAEEFVGKMFGIGKLSGAPLYTQKVQVDQQPDGTTVTIGEMFDASGKMILREHAVYSGSTFISQEIDNHIDHKEYRASLKDKKATFETYSLDNGGEKKLLSSSHETVHSTMVSGPTAESFIRDNWQALMNGKRVDFRFAVFERQETIGFAFKKKAEADVDGKPAVILTMRPTSLFVAMVVSPMEISVDKESKTIIHYKGRTPVKIDKNENLQAEIVYERNKPSISRATAHEKAN